MKADEFSRHLEDCAQTACLLEATARKPGNVHPRASFTDLSYDDLIASAKVVAPLLARTRQHGVGPAILEAVRATRSAVGHNTNLGIVLLLAPLAAVDPDRTLHEGIADVLDSTSVEDAAFVYEAIRLAQPGGLGRAPEQDVAGPPTDSLIKVMQRAAGRDAIAAEYADAFRWTLDVGLPFLAEADNFPGTWESDIVRLHLKRMAEYPDTLIARKCGIQEAEHAARMASDVLQSGGPQRAAGREKLDQLDAWLRADENRRNPGATADLIAAALFSGLRERRITPPPEGTFGETNT